MQNHLSCARFWSQTAIYTATSHSICIMYEWIFFFVVSLHKSRFLTPLCPDPKYCCINWKHSLSCNRNFQCPDVCWEYALNAWIYTSGNWALTLNNCARYGYYPVSASDLSSTQIHSYRWYSKVRMYVARTLPLTPCWTIHSGMLQLFNLIFTWEHRILLYNITH